MKKITKTERIHIYLSDLEGTISQVLQNIEEKVAEAMTRGAIDGTCKLEVDYQFYDEPPDLNLRFERWETDKELENRKKSLMRKREKNKKSKEDKVAQELALLDKLKKKYEGKI